MTYLVIESGFVKIVGKAQKGSLGRALQKKSSIYTLTEIALGMPFYALYNSIFTPPPRTCCKTSTYGYCLKIVLTFTYLLNIVRTHLCCPIPHLPPHYMGHPISSTFMGHLISPPHLWGGRGGEITSHLLNKF